MMHCPNLFPRFWIACKADLLSQRIIAVFVPLCFVLADG